MMRDYARLQTAILLRRFAFQVNRAARAGDADSIHDLRVSIRRLNRCLRVFSQFYPPGAWKRPRRKLSGLMEAAGAVRDRDIAMQLLGESGVPQRAAIMTQLRAERSRAAHDLSLAIQRWQSRDFSQKWRARLEL